MIRKLTQQERAAMWLYHAEYAKSGIGAIEFYKQLGQYQKNRVDEMIADVVAYEHPPRRAGKKASRK